LRRSYDKEKPLPDLGRQFDDGFHAAFADGSVRFFGNGTDPNLLRALITSNGREAISGDKVLVAPGLVIQPGEPTPRKRED
jgi:hypothetical protein